MCWVKTQNLQGVTSPASIQRACLDATSGQLTVFYTTPNDACGSFREHVLYGRDDVSLPFVYLGKNTNSTSSNFTVNLPNKKQWQVYLVTRYACNLTDTFSSNYVFVDNTAPALLNIDSVSVEMSTQQVVAGWRAAPEPDVMGYSIFKVDVGTGNNILLKDTSTLFYRFSTSTFSSSNTGNRIAIAVFDSCTNGGIICNYHSPVYVSFNMSANVNYRCDKKFRFTWTPYIGWDADRYGIWYEVSSSGKWVYLGDVTNTSYMFDIPELNNTYRFFVRAFKSPGNNSITSTSNIITVSLPGHPKPSQNSLGHVSVINSNTLEITGKWNAPVAGYTGELFFSEDSFVWKPLQKTGNNFTVIQSGLLPSQKKCFYRNIVSNPCNETIDTSVIHSNIVLTRNFNLLNWNEYFPWAGNLVYNLQKKSASEVLWGLEIIGTNNKHFLADTALGLCFRVQAVKGNNEDAALSNIVCVFVKDTTLIPSAFNPEGNNSKFRIVNPNISTGQATMSIYDRWGGKLWEGDALSGWTGTHNGDLLPVGLYVYKISVRRPIKNELFSGTVLLIR